MMMMRMMMRMMMMRMMVGDYDCDSSAQSYIMMVIMIMMRERFCFYSLRNCQLRICSVQMNNQQCLDVTKLQVDKE